MCVVVVSFPIVFFFDVLSSKVLPASAETTCPKCHSDFFSAEEMKGHIRAGCSGPAPVVQLKPIKVSSGDEQSDAKNTSSPGLASSKRGGFLSTVRTQLRPSREEDDEVHELTIGAPTNVSHSATADASGRVVRLDGSNSQMNTPVQSRRAVPATPGAVPTASAGIAGASATASPALSAKRASLAPGAGQLQETVVEFERLRVQVTEALGTRLRANRARVRLVLAVGNDKRSTEGVLCDIPGVADFSQQGALCLPADLAGKNFVISLYCKPMAEMNRSSSSSRIDQITQKVNLVGVSETLYGMSAEVSVGSISNKTGPFVQVIQGCKPTPGSPLESTEMGVVTCTSTTQVRAPISELARHFIAKRKEVEEIKTVESCKLLAKKLNDIVEALNPGAPPPARYIKAKPSTDSGDPVKDAMESWPPRFKVVCEAVKRGYRPTDGSFRNWAGQTVMHMAVMGGDADAVRLVLRFGLEHDPNAEGMSMDKDGTVNVKRAPAKKPFFKSSDRDESGISPLFLAVILGHVPALAEILDFDTDAVNQTLYSLSLLHVAAAVGKMPMVQYMVDTVRMPVDIKDQNSATPVFYSAFGGFDEVSEFLIGRGAFVDLEDGQSQSPIMMAMEAGHENTARMLLRYKADVNTLNLRGDNAIWLCIVRNMPSLLSEFVRSGACELEAGLERHRNTLLHKLIMFIDNEQMGCMMVASLLSHGAKVDAVNDEKKTALFHAVALSKAKIVTLLLNSGANPKATDAFDNTPLHFAFWPPIASTLVEKGADPNASNMDGMTPMHIMSAFGMTETVCCLRALGGSLSREREREKSDDLFCFRKRHGEK
jgi:ankyrin repeat protein